MRPDIDRVIVERPRLGGKFEKKSRRDEEKRKSIRSAANDSDRYDEFSNIESIKIEHRWNRKTLNENLNPLKRFFEARVGNLWNKIYSEVREHLDTGSAVKQHVADHIKDIVEIHTEIRGGVIGSFRYSGFLPVDGLYVHPITGVLCRTKTKRPRARFPRPGTKHPIVRHPTDRLVQYRLIEDVWYTIRLAQAPALIPIAASETFGRRSHYTDTRFRLYEKIKDIIFPLGTDQADRKKEYGDSGLRAVKKAQCGRRELKYIRENYRP